MGKVGMTAILEAQLEAANATIRQLSLRLESVTKTMEEQSATIKSLESTIRNLEELLLKKEDALSSAEEQKKARGNNGAKRNMHYEITVEQKDVRPDDSIVGNPDAEEIGAWQRWGRRQQRTPAGIFFPTSGRRSSNHTHF